MSGTRYLLSSAIVLALGAGAAAAGGIEWMSPSTGVGLLFEKGKRVEFSLGYVKPHVSGTVVGAPVSSGNMLKSYMPYSIGFKLPINNSVDAAFMVNSANGANVAYPAGTGYPYAGSTAKITDREYKALLRYHTPSNFSVYGGVRMSEAKGEANVIAAPLGLNYTLQTQSNSKAGWLAGVAYEIQKIAMRVSLTYSSPIKHTFNSTEGFVGGPTGIPGQFSTTLPKSWILDFQTGVAKDTLLFGSVEWREWKAFDISPPNYPANPLVSYDNNVMTYSLGVGRKFNENWSGALSFGYEKSNGGFAGNLGPTDGYKSVTLAMIYTKDQMKISGGISYIKIGDAQTENPLAPGTALSNFTKNHAIGVGVKVGYSF